MISTIAATEAKKILRSSAHLAALAAVIALIAASIFVSAERLRAFERERNAAAAVDRAVWDGQGERNPHSAAHFSRYAFRPHSPLAAFDPGVSDYAGLAVWMEAHNRNPAAFRRAEETGDSASLASLSPAWALQYPVALVIFLFLFASIAGEREQGSLRQVAASGVRARALLAGKGLGAAAIIAAILIPAMALCALSISATESAALPDMGLRAGALVASYGVYFAIIAALGIGISALFRERRAAAIAVVGLWAFSFIVLPRSAAELALSVHPDPSPEAIGLELSAASEKYWVDEAYMEADRRAVLLRYGVDDVEKLPINFDAYTLQRSEELSHPLFDDVYRNLAALHDRQERIQEFAAILSPPLALARLSAGIAGTDRRHQQAFADDAEAARRALVKTLNTDMLTKAGALGYEYKATDDLWRSITDFRHVAPRLSTLTGHYAGSAATLLLQLVFSILFAAFAVNRALRKAAS